MDAATPSAFADLLRRRRRDQGLTQEALAERAGISVRAIADLERGVNRAPRRDTLALLADAMGLSSEERARWERLRRTIATRSTQTASLQASDCEPQPRSSLPAPMTSFVGREREIDEVVRLLHRTDQRLVTLTGMGGVGKTRLALAVAHSVHSSYSDGCWFVDLAPLSDPDLVLSTVAARLDVTPVAGQSLVDSIVSTLRSDRRLLVLDNMEQVVGAAPDLVAILAACPGVSILVTSRIPLRVPGEQEFPLAPLDIPDTADSTDPERLHQNESVALFVQRVQAITPDFILTTANATAVAAICQRLEGIPLALELAAARIRSLPPEAILHRLDDRLMLLRSDARGGPDRHHTLRDAIRWSYDLLPANEQRLFRSMSVFRGGWSLDAAAAVAGPDLQLDVLDGLEQLIEHSLVRVREQPDGEPRYSMLETIREFGLECVRTHEEVANSHARHHSYITALVEQTVAVSPRGASQSDGLRRLEREHDNLRAALSWSISQQDAETALRLSGRLAEFWRVQGHFVEGRNWLQAALALPDPSVPGPRAYAANRLGYCLRDEGDYLRAEQYHSQALTLFREIADTTGIADALNQMGWIALYQADYQRANDLCEQALAAARMSGDLQMVADVLSGIGSIAGMEGEYQLAESHFMESLTLLRKIDNRPGIGRMLSFLGMVTLWRGDIDRATEWTRQCLTLAAEIGDLWTTTVGSELDGLIQLERGAYREARTAFDQSLRLSQHHSAPTPMFAAMCMEGLAGVAAGQAGFQRAARLLGAAEALREKIATPLPLPRRRRYEQTCTAVQSDLDDALFAQVWSEGRSLSLSDAVAYALSDDP